MPKSPLAGLYPDHVHRHLGDLDVFSYLIVYDPDLQPLGVARILHASRDLEALFTTRPPRP